MSQRRAEQLVASVLHCFTLNSGRGEKLLLLKQMGPCVSPVAAAEMENPQTVVLKVAHVRISCIHTLQLC